MWLNFGGWARDIFLVDLGFFGVGVMHNFGDCGEGVVLGVNFGVSFYGQSGWLADVLQMRIWTQMFINFLGETKTLLLRFTFNIETELVNVITVADAIVILMFPLHLFFDNIKQIFSFTMLFSASHCSIVSSKVP